MNSKSLLLKERSQTQKATYYLIPYKQNGQISQIHRDKNYIGGCQGLEVGGYGRTTANE